MGVWWPKQAKLTQGFSPQILWRNSPESPAPTTLDKSPLDQKPGGQSRTEYGGRWGRRHSSLRTKWSLWRGAAQLWAAVGVGLACVYYLWAPMSRVHPPPSLSLSEALKQTSRSKQVSGWMRKTDLQHSHGLDRTSQLNKGKCQTLCHSLAPEFLSDCMIYTLSLVGVLQVLRLGCPASGPLQRRFLFSVCS